MIAELSFTYPYYFCIDIKNLAVPLRSMYCSLTHSRDGECFHYSITYWVSSLFAFNFPVEKFLLFFDNIIPPISERFEEFSQVWLFGSLLVDPSPAGHFPSCRLACYISSVTPLPGSLSGQSRKSMIQPLLLFLRALPDWTSWHKDPATVIPPPGLPLLQDPGIPIS